LGAVAIIFWRVTSSHRFSCVERLADDSVSFNRRSRSAVDAFSGSMRICAHVQRASVRVLEENVSGLKLMA
jgi:hypothetical protein